MTTERSWVLTYDAKPPLANAARREHWSAQAAATLEWRSAFYLLAKQRKVPALGQISIIVNHYTKTQRLPDICACMPAFKAALDGLVDAHIVADDSPAFVRLVTFVMPICTGADGLSLQIIEL